MLGVILALLKVKFDAVMLEVKEIESRNSIYSGRIEEWNYSE
jgi:hypothetical protein